MVVAQTTECCDNFVRKRIMPCRDSEGFIVPFEDSGQYNP